MAENEEQRVHLSKAELGGNENMYRLPGLDRYALLPGDHKRISLMALQWDRAQEYDLKRGFRAATGLYKGGAISAFSTGMGGPSAEDVILGIAACGVDTMIRVGTTGALQDGMELGDVVINDACIRMDGTSADYIRPEYPAAASPVVTLALIQAAERLGVRYHVGVGYTASSFYAGQFRPSFNGYKPSWMEKALDDLAAAGVLNSEMEGATLFTLARIFGLRAGMCACVVAQRRTGDYGGTENIRNACLVGAEAIHILQEWDRLCAEHKQLYFTPDLLMR
ncbi:MAG: nucleoside phosphorylase [Oscillospiraceae bacterium]|nr:nucleoside phosphorylase [Oscillospiraceae bacterium]